MRPIPDQARLSPTTLCYEFQHSPPDGRGEWDALLAAEQYDSHLIISERYFKFAMCLPTYWQDSVLNLLHLFCFFLFPGFEVVL